MPDPAQHKRLRVRLKARDSEALARDFGVFMRDDGLFLPCRQSLPVGTPVRLQLMYADGALAMEGRGRVQSFRESPLPGLELHLTWMGPSLSLVRWCRTVREAPLAPTSSLIMTKSGNLPSIPAVDTQALVADLQPPDVGQTDDPSGWPDGDEPLADGPLSVSSDDIGDDEPLLTQDLPERIPTGDAPTSEPINFLTPDLRGDDDDFFDEPTVIADSSLPAEADEDEDDDEVQVRPVESSLSGDLEPPPFHDPDLLVIDAPEVISDDAIEPLDDDDITQVEKSRVDAPDVSMDIVIVPPVELVEATDESPFHDEVSGPVAPKPLSGEFAAPKGVIELEESEAGASADVAVYGAPLARAPLLKQGEDREPGEVTPLARIALVRRRVGEISVEGEVPPTAIPSKRNRPALPDRGRTVVGIDVGTATTGTAVMTDDGPARLQSRRGMPVIPSTVLIESSGKTFVGEAAMRKLPWQPRMGIAGPSRLLGRVAGGPASHAWRSEMTCSLISDDESEVAARFGEHVVSMEEVVALLLKEVRASATLALQEPINRAVFTCPSFFGARQRRALHLAAELAGFHVERIVSAPLAAAVGFTEGRLSESRVMIVDCGAGALDVGLVEISPTGYELIAARGSRALGGEAYDELLVQHLAKETQDLEGAQGVGGYFDIREAAELAKLTLTEQESAGIDAAHVEEAPEAGPSWKLRAEIKRSEAEQLFLPLVEETIELCKQVCEDANCRPEAIDAVVPVGGQARIPLLIKHLRETFKGALNVVEPQDALPFGAAHVAGRIADSRPLRLREMVPHPVVLGRKKGTVDRLLMRGERLPAVAGRRIKIPDPSGLDLFLFEGDSPRVLAAEPLVRISIINLPTDITYPISVDLTVEMNEEGLLRFEVVEQRSGVVLDTVQNGDLTLESIKRGLEIADGDGPDAQERGLFGWLLKRLSREEPT